MLLGVLRSNNAEDPQIDQLEKALEEDGARAALGQAIETELTQEGSVMYMGDADEYEASSTHLTGEYSSYPSGEEWHTAERLAEVAHRTLQVALLDEYKETPAGKLIVALLRSIKFGDFVKYWSEHRAVSQSAI